MLTPSYGDIKGYDQVHGTDWIGSIRGVCEKYALPGHVIGVFAQFRTDWTSGGLRYALCQTLRYVGYGYINAMVFKEMGEVLGRMFEAIESGTRCDS